MILPNTVCGYIHKAEYVRALKNMEGMPIAILTKIKEPKIWFRLSVCEL